MSAKRWPSGTYPHSPSRHRRAWSPQRSSSSSSQSAKVNSLLPACLQIPARCNAISWKSRGKVGEMMTGWEKERAGLVQVARLKGSIHQPPAPVTQKQTTSDPFLCSDCCGPEYLLLQVVGFTNPNFLAPEAKWKTDSFFSFFRSFWLKQQSWCGQCEKFKKWRCCGSRIPPVIILHIWRLRWVKHFKAWFIKYRSISPLTKWWC